MFLKMESLFISYAVVFGGGTTSCIVEPMRGKLDKTKTKRTGEKWAIPRNSLHPSIEQKSGSHLMG